MNKRNEKYGFVTAISMVIGIVIGSGIFFKADDILIATGGDVVLGLLGFLVVGIGVLFGALVISEYAINNTSEGGIIPFAKDAFGPTVAYFVSWFMISVYFPALIVILAFVTAIYIGVFLNIESNIFLYSATFLVLLFAFISNVFFKRFGAGIQNVSTIITLIPLFIIGAFGLLFFDNSATTATQIPSDIVANKSFFSALIAIAFTFDGWIVVTSIAGEIKNPKKTLPAALAVGVLVTITIYILYFIGMTNIVPAGDIIALGDSHVDVAAQAIFGTYGSKIITGIVVIAVYGGVNGMVLAYLRLPHAVANQGMMRNLFNIKEINPKNGLSNISVAFAGVFLLIFLAIQILINEGILFGNLEVAFDLSTLPIIIVYIIYIFLYIFVFKVTKKKGFGLIKIGIFAFIAIVISLLVIYGSLQSNGLLYIVLSIIAMIIGIPLFNFNNSNVLNEEDVDND